MTKRQWRDLDPDRRSASEALKAEDLAKERTEPDSGADRAEQEAELLSIDAEYGQAQQRLERRSRYLLYGGAALLLLLIFVCSLFMRRQSFGRRSAALASQNLSPDLSGQKAPVAVDLAPDASEILQDPAQSGDNPFKTKAKHKLDDAQRQPGADGVIEIQEKYFVALSNDIYINNKLYLGKRIRMEGLYKEAVVDGKLYHFAIRYGPGCCAYDQTCGFEIHYNGQWPKEDEWVSVTGTLKQYEDQGRPYLYLELEDLTVKQERGAERVGF